MSITNTSAPRVAVVGATGAVGKQLLSILEQRKFPVSDLRLFSSPRSKGKTIQFNGKSWACQVMEPGCFQGVDIAFFDASDAVSKEWVPQAVEAGAWVIDNSAVFRMEEDVPLLVPEVNGHVLDARLSTPASSLKPRQRILSG